MTNHRNTKKGVIKGGFDRTNLFQNVEEVFDKLFSYDRLLTETFEYCNIMKNGSISEQLKMQEKENNQTVLHADKQMSKDEDLEQTVKENKQKKIKKRNIGLKF